jgi:hypothetical protein
MVHQAARCAYSNSQKTGVGIARYPKPLPEADEIQEHASAIDEILKFKIRRRTNRFDGRARWATAPRRQCFTETSARIFKTEA